MGPIVSSQPTQAGLLDDADDPLAHLYNQLLRFVERDVYRLMKIADEICNNSGDSSGTNIREGTSIANLSSSGYNLLSNVVWDEIGRSIIDEIGAQVFAAGKPTELRKVIWCCSTSFDIC